MKNKAFSYSAPPYGTSVSQEIRDFIDANPEMSPPDIRKELVAQGKNINTVNRAVSEYMYKKSNPTPHGFKQIKATPVACDEYICANKNTEGARGACTHQLIIRIPDVGPVHLCQLVKVTRVSTGPKKMTDLADYMFALDKTDVPTGVEVFEIATKSGKLYVYKG